MELKHLRKGKIDKIKTEVLAKELSKLEDRQARYEKDIKNNTPRRNKLFEILAKSGEGTHWSRWTWDSVNEHEVEVIFSADKEEYFIVNDIIEGAKHALKKMQKKKKLIEDEVIDRTLTGEK